MAVMRKIFFILIIISSIAVSLLAEGYHFPIDKINETLKYISIDTSDVRFRTDRVDLDSFRLPIVDIFTAHPLALPDFLKNKSDLLIDPDKNIVEIFMQAAKMISPEISFLNYSETKPQWVANLFPTLKNRSKQVSEFRDLAADLIWSLHHWQDSSMYNRPITFEESAFLADSFTMFLTEEEESVNKTALELDSLQKFSEGLALRFKEIGIGLDPENVLTTHLVILSKYNHLYSFLRNNREVLSELVKAKNIIIETPAGRVVIGGSGDNIYKGKYALIIDFGGNDIYELSYDEEHPNQVIIDCAGDDKYYAQSDHVFGSGYFGIGLLDDWSGADMYIARHFSLGCGLFGSGILIDRQGNDLYRGDICTQAAGSFGVGMLLDYEGHDTYTANLYSQGFGHIMGVGTLIDRQGNDTYTAGWKYGDILRYENHYLSLSQGFGYGLRPHFSGGVGLLIDGGGNDQYSADIFAQGASYWWSIGGLIDYSGTDRYIAHQYAQGSATHLCLAALIDIEGSDLYSSKGVSQGCGHDLAFGLLLDCHGDDQYNAFDLSQAAGSANGVGMLIDLYGNDGHLARVKKNTHGYGNPRRDYGSIGLFLDLDGNDDYRGYGNNHSYWVTDSKWGIGADLSVEADSGK